MQTKVCALPIVLELAFLFVLTERKRKYDLHRTAAPLEAKQCPAQQSWTYIQGFGSGSGLDPYSIGPEDPDPDPYSESGSGSRRAKMTHKSRKFFLQFTFWSIGWPLLWAVGFFCNLDILYGGLGIGKLQFLITKFFFFSCNFFFFNFRSLKLWIRIGSGSVSGSVLVSSLNIWIRIRKKWIRIRNTAYI